MKDSEQRADLMVEALSGTARSYVLKTDNLCMFAGVIYDDVKYFVIVKEEEAERQNLNYVLKKKDETVRSHKEDHIWRKIFLLSILPKL